MSLVSRYNIKYNLDGGMDENLVSRYIEQITKIYHMVNEKYNGYMTDKKDTVILSGSAAILYYLHSLGFKDLIINESFQSPTDVDLLMVYYTKMKPVIDELYIEDFKQIIKKSNSHAIKVSSATFKNEWTSDEIKKFVLTFVPFSGTHWNEVNGINVLDLKELKSFYDEDKDLEERHGRDYPKIEIIKQILERLELTPRPDIIKPGVRYESTKTKPTNKSSTPTLTNKIVVNLFGSTPSETPVRTLSFDTPNDNLSPEKSHDFVPRIIDFGSEITPVKSNRKLNFEQ